MRTGMSGTHWSARTMAWRSGSPQAARPSVARGSSPNAHPGETRAIQQHSAGSNDTAPHDSTPLPARFNTTPRAIQAAVLSERLGDLRKRGVLAVLATAAGAAATATATAALPIMPRPRRPGGPMLVRFLAPSEICTCQCVSRDCRQPVLAAGAHPCSDMWQPFNAGCAPCRLDTHTRPPICILPTLPSGIRPAALFVDGLMAPLFRDDAA